MICIWGHFLSLLRKWHDLWKILYLCFQKLEFQQFWRVSFNLGLDFVNCGKILYPQIQTDLSIITGLLPFLLPAFYSISLCFCCQLALVFTENPSFVFVYPSSLIHLATRRSELYWGQKIQTDFYHPDYLGSTSYLLSQLQEAVSAEFSQTWQNLLAKLDQQLLSHMSCLVCHYDAQTSLNFGWFSRFHLSNFVSNSTKDLTISVNRLFFAYYLTIDAYCSDSIEDDWLVCWKMWSGKVGRVVRRLKMMIIFVWGLKNY